MRALILQVDVYSWVTGQGELNKVRVGAALKVCINFSDCFVYPVAHVSIPRRIAKGVVGPIMAL